MNEHSARAMPHSHWGLLHKDGGRAIMNGIESNKASLDRMC